MNFITIQRRIKRGVQQSDRVMRDLGFTCYFDYENYEQEVKVYNRYLLYRQTITVERIAYLNSLI